METMRGKIDHVFPGANEEWMAGVLRLADGSTRRFAGNVNASLGEWVVLSGEWKEDKKFGRQFKVAGMVVDLDLDPAALETYLAHNPRFEGIGPVRARAIVQLFGSELDDALANRAETVAVMTQTPLEHVENLARVWRELREVNAVYVALAGYGLTYKQTKRLVDKLGGNAVAIIQRDPYRLPELVPGLGFKRIDDVVMKTALMEELDPRRIRAGVSHTLRKMLAQDGHTWCEFRELVLLVNAYLQFNALDADEHVERVIVEMLEAGELGSIDDGSITCVTLPDVLAAELSVTAMLAEAVRRDGLFDPDYAERMVALVRPDLAHELNESQELAAINAFSRRVSLVSGAAGTGKTTAVEAIVRAALEEGVVIALAALSGKAAKRLSQVVGFEAATVHRLLGSNGQWFTHCRSNPIEAALVVVDEASMLDIRLAESLINAIDFDRTSLVLVGDPHQLPPVGPGATFRDLIESGIVPAVKLTQVQRHAGYLAEACSDILLGAVRPTCGALDGAMPAWANVTRLNESREVIEQLVRIFDEKLDKYGLDPFEDVQVITPWNKGDLGTEVLNTALQAFLQRKVFGVDLSVIAPSVRRHQRFWTGDKVIQTRNDYELGVMNGEMGRVVGVAGDAVFVEFDGREDAAPVALEIGSDEFDNLSLAYALTIHKAQGSEFPVVIAVIHRKNLYTLNRELLYTAATRARRSLVILGDGYGARHAASKPTAHRRRTLTGQVGLRGAGRAA